MKSGGGQALSIALFSLSSYTAREAIRQKHTWPIVSFSTSTKVHVVVDNIKTTWHRLFRRYTPWIRTIPLCQGIRWLPSWKALPSKGACGRRDSGRFSTLPFELNCFLQLSSGMFPFGAKMPLWLPRIRYHLDRTIRVINFSLRSPRS